MRPSVGANVRLYCPSSACAGEVISEHGFYYRIRFTYVCSYCENTAWWSPWAHVRRGDIIDVFASLIQPYDVLIDELFRKFEDTETS